MSGGPSWPDVVLLQSQYAPVLAASGQAPAASAAADLEFGFER